MKANQMNQFDNSSKTDNKSPFVLALLLVLSISIYYIGGNMNGWWGQTTSGENALITQESSESFVASPGIERNSIVATNESESFAPDFSLSSIHDDEIIYALSQFRGQPIILNFWASWCGPCRVEMPAFQAAYEEYGKDGLIVIAVNQTFMDDVDAAREFANTMGLTFPLLKDDDGRVSEGLYQVRGLPMTLVIRPDGTIAFGQIGPMSEEQIMETSQKLIAGEAVP